MPLSRLWASFQFHLLHRHLLISRGVVRMQLIALHACTAEKLIKSSWTFDIAGIVASACMLLAGREITLWIALLKNSVLLFMQPCMQAPAQEVPATMHARADPCTVHVAVAAAGRTLKFRRQAD